MSDSSLVVVGVGARTPVGRTAAASAAAVRASISRIVEHPYMLDKSGEPYRVAMDESLLAHAREERLYALASAAIDEALHAAPLHVRETLWVWVALPEESASFRPADAALLLQQINARVAARSALQLHAVTRGHAAGILALEQARSALQNRQCKLALVVGVDSHLDADFLEQLDLAGRLISATNRWGYPPGEGAGALLVASSASASQLGLRELGRVVGLGLAHEPNLIASDANCVGAGLAGALGSALQAGDSDEPVREIYCDINGERYRSSEYVYAALRLGALLPNPTLYNAPADCWGDVGAATSILLCCLALAAGERGFAAGAKALVWCGSEGGLRGAAVLRVKLMPRAL